MTLTKQSFEGDPADEKSLEGVGPKKFGAEEPRDPSPWDFPLRDKPPFHVSGEN